MSGWCWFRSKQPSARAWKALAKIYRDDLHLAARDFEGKALTLDSLQKQVEALQYELLGSECMQRSYAERYFEMRGDLEKAQDEAAKYKDAWQEAEVELQKLKADAPIAAAAKLVDWPNAMRRCLGQYPPVDVLEFGAVVLAHIDRQQAKP